MRRVLALAVLVVGCATTAAPRSSAHGLALPAGTTGWRAVGILRIATPEGAATVDVALLTDRRERVRLEAMLPTGTPAGMLWIGRGTWVAADPVAAVAYRGTVDEIVAAANTLPLVLQAGLALGLAINFLNLNGDFATIWSLAALPATAPAATAALRLFPEAGGGRIFVASADPWHVSFEPPPDTTAWPYLWAVARRTVRMEVQWQRLTALGTADERLLVPRLPSSFSLRPLRDVTAVTTTAAPSAAPPKTPPPAP